MSQATLEDDFSRFLAPYLAEFTRVYQEAGRTWVIRLTRIRPYLFATSPIIIDGLLYVQIELIQSTTVIASFETYLGGSIHDRTAANRVVYGESYKAEVMERCAEYLLVWGRARLVFTQTRFQAPPVVGLREPLQP